MLTAELFSQRTVLELGAGVGLTALTVSRVQPKELIATDFATEVLDNLAFNVQISKFVAMCLNTRQCTGTGGKVGLDLRIETTVIGTLPTRGDDSCRGLRRLPAFFGAQSVPGV